MLGSMVVSVKVRCDVVSVLGIMAVGVMILVMVRCGMWVW